MPAPVPSTPTPQPGDHYFEEQPRSRSDPTTIELLLPDLQLTLRTDRGVFSRTKVDTGTKLLLLTQPPAQVSSAPETIADLGAGYGPIALTLARRHQAATVWAIERNARARELCLQNADVAGLTNVRVAAPDEVPDEVTFDQVWSNPPIRIGKQQLHALLLRWFGCLSPSGHAMFVVQKHLGADALQRWLTTQGFEADRYRSQKGYRLLAVKRAL